MTISLRKKKVCLIASSGGHYEQILMLRKLENDVDVFIVTEETNYAKKDDNTYYIKQINRQEKKLLLKILLVFIESLKIFYKEKPDVIISTGALCVIPMFIIGKVTRKKLIFIESFAKVNTPTLTGKFLYKYTDIFIVQWEELLDVYPNALYMGSIY